MSAKFSIKVSGVDAEDSVYDIPTVLAAAASQIEEIIDDEFPLKGKTSSGGVTLSWKLEQAGQ